jgi:hypothetical protein
VDQDVDEDWVLEVYDHNGRATNVTMEPGDMVLYESTCLPDNQNFLMQCGEIVFANFFASILLIRCYRSLRYVGKCDVFSIVV